MTLAVLAELCQSLYYDGRVISNDQKLEIEDFEQMVYAALGDVGRIEWYQEAQRGNQDFYWGKCITTDTFIVEKQKRKLVIILDRGVMTIPRSSGVIRVYPTTEENDSWDDDLQKIAPGSETFYANPKSLDDTGMKVYVPKGNILETYGVEEGDELDVDYIPLDLELDIPEGLCWVIIKEITGVSGPSAAKSVDNTEDGDPNINSYKARLDDPKAI